MLTRSAAPAGAPLVGDGTVVVAALVDEPAGGLDVPGDDVDVGDEAAVLDAAAEVGAATVAVTPVGGVAPSLPQAAAVAASAVRAAAARTMRDVRVRVACMGPPKRSGLTCR